ncbi:MAG: hypothetical protein EAZ47_11305 [Bacteroidetes bacterium]|nr:MAG: hypothetical protein EAY72_12535 [Bacteroidota bacterium]TAF90050.1 MAG: hypothetical protein EAZ47_11305 [Bacteroidota bacterium]
MKIKSLLAKPYAAYKAKKVQQWRETAVADQQKLLLQLVAAAKNTAFGKEHGFATISTYDQYIKAVPVRDYEQIKHYVALVKEGKENILWPGKPLYFAKTSGTTSGVKYIPISKDSIHNHINTAKTALLCYMAETGNTQFAAGKLIFLSGSPELERVGGVPTGRLSGIVNHHVPSYLRGNQLPSFTTNCINDWEEKLDAIVNETMHQNMTLISGIPPWVQMYFDRLQEKTGKKIAELFPNFSLMVQGGVNFAPYKQKLIDAIGKPIDTIELFPASEGFFAFQDTQTQEGLLLNTQSGIFFEFIPVSELGKENPKRIWLQDVQLGENYALIISSNAGLWAYNIGDTVKFVSKEPYRIVVTGRIKHFISAFGEHVIGEEVDGAMQAALQQFPEAKVTEFTVAPLVSQTKEKSYHEWFIEFETMPNNLAAFAKALDEALQKKNAYYFDLITGNILQPLQITKMEKGGFIQYMKSIGKLGGQNKLPRLSNDRVLADALLPYVVQ